MNKEQKKEFDRVNKLILEKPHNYGIADDNFGITKGLLFVFVVLPICGLLILNVVGKALNAFF